MTSPTSVGEASVDIVADLKKFAAGLKSQVESAFKGLDFDRLIRESIGNKPIKVPVRPDFDTDGLGEKVRAARVPKIPVKLDPDTSAIPAKIKATPVPKVKVEADPVLTAFQAELRGQVAALAKTVNAKVPVGAETGGLRAELGAQLAEIQHSLKAEIPTEPGSRADYEAKLKAMVESASERVKASIKTEPQSDSLNLSGVSGLAGKLTPNLLGGGAVSAISSLFQNLGDSVSKFAGEAAQGGSQLAASVASAAGPVGAIVGLLVSAQAAALALGAAATVLVPAFAAAAGAAAAIPAGLTGIGAAVATLSLGFKGISDAFKPKTAAAGGGAANSAAQQARQVAAASRQVEAARRGIVAANRASEASERSLAAAERGVATAQRNLVDAENAVAEAQKKAQLAQVAVNKARQEAADDLVDLNLQLKDSQLSEEEASLAVTDALRNLNAVKLTGNIPDIQKADLAYQRAQLTLQEATQSTKELGKQTADANAKGVEGSDKVQSALRDQQDALQGVQKAQEGVLDAQNGILDAADSLKSAQDGVASAADGIKSAQDSLASATDSLASAQTKQAAGAAAAAQQIIKLAPAAQRFVDALKALKPAFEDLRLDVQQRLFQGLDQTVTRLGEAWIPALKVTLGSYADTFNGFFKNLGAAVSTPKFITDLQAGAEGARQGLAKVGDAITASLVPAFGDLSAAAGPFLSQLGGDIAEVVSKFGEWIDKAGKTGRLQTFFDRASKAMHEIFTTGTLVVQIVGEIIGILIGTQATSGKTALDSFNDGLEKVKAYLDDPKHQKEIADFVNDLRDGLTKFGDAAGKVDTFLSAIDGQKGQSHSAGYDIGAALVAGLLAGLEGAMMASLDTFLSYFSPFGPLVAGVKTLLGIHSPSTVFAEIGGNLIDGLIVGIEGSIGGLLDQVGQIPGLVIGLLKDAATWLTGIGENTVIGFIDGLIGRLGQLGSYTAQIKTTVQSRVSDAGSWLSAHGQNVVIGLINGIGGRLGQLGTAARNIAGTVIGSLGNLYGEAVAYGENVVIGLYNGIISLGSFIYNNLVAWVHNNIPAAIRNALGIASPSKVAHELGAYVGQGLAQGLTSEGDRVQAAAEAIAAKATPQIADATFGLGAMADAKLSASLQASSSQQLQLSWKQGATMDPVLRALQTVINVQYRGDVQAAFTGK